jgi:hypothetical protein
MKQTLLLILLIFTFSNNQAQELSANSTTLNKTNIIGNWGLDYVDYQDGTHLNDNDDFQREVATMLLFKKTGIITLIYHAKAVNTNYSLENDLIAINQEVYKVEKLTPQEFVFTIYNATAQEESYKIRRYHYLATKESSEQFYVRKFVKPNVRIKANGDTAYAFCEDFHPHFIIANNKFELTNFRDVFQDSYQTIEQKFNFPEKKKGRFNLTFEITKEGKIETPKVKESSDSTYNEQLLKALASTAGSWKAAEYKFKPVAIQFNYIFEYEDKSEEENKVVFDAEIYEYNLNKANNFFVKQNYEKAVKYYTKCILMTDDAIEALYKRADCYFTVNALKNACSDWNYLAGKGQKKAERLYLEHCMK